MTHFGTTSDGRDVEAFTLSAHGITATVLSLGAILQDLRLDGMDYSLTVGSDQLRDYEGAMKNHGAIVGPVANRLSGAQAVIDGMIHQFDANFLGKHTLHGGTTGTHMRIWDGVQTGDDHLELSLELADGDGGFPGNRHITAAFDILPGPALRLTITTTTDAPSIANLTNHSYWNLDGKDHMRDHTLKIMADAYLPTDNEFLTTGEIVPTASSSFDFNNSTKMTLAETPVDNTFCLARDRREMTEVLHLEGASGISMRVATTEPGIHIFDDRPNHRSIAIEAQGWPDAPNKSGFPSIAVTPEAPAVQITEWRFTSP